MDRIEMLLAATLDERADRAPVGPVLLDEPSRPRRPVTLAVLAACAVVALLTVGVAVLARSDHGTTPVAPHHDTRTLPAPENLPAGLRLASYGAISLRVPVALRTRTALCGGPVKNEVVAPDDALRLCPVVTHRLAAQPGVVIWFSGSSQHNPYSRISTSPARLANQDVRRGYGTNLPDLGTGVSGVVQLPNAGVMVGVTAPTRAAVDRLLNSLSTAQLDPLGCAVQFGSTVKLNPGPADALVPATADAAIRCVYATTGPRTNTLIGSYRLNRSATAGLTKALNQLEPDPCNCAHGGTVSPGHDEIVYFHLASGWTLRVTGRIGANLDTYTNGTLTVANFTSTVAALLARLTGQI
jgi:hypothetical protein